MTLYVTLHSSCRKKLNTAILLNTLHTVCKMDPQNKITRSTVSDSALILRLLHDVLMSLFFSPTFSKADTNCSDLQVSLSPMTMYLTP